ncbi:MAG: hypothetical protein OXC44_01550 [Proteobacteria bacterium]|nr:hypothetical protein [Pseudomonadota bacterium]
MPAQARKKKSSKALLKKATWKDLDKILEHRKHNLMQLYGKKLGDDGVEALFNATTQARNFEQTMEKGTVHLFYNTAAELMGHIQMKYSIISGDNGVGKMLSFSLDPDYLMEDTFAVGLADVEQRAIEAGCCKIKGTASYKEFQLIKPFGYSIAAPKYRHSFGNISVNFIPFSKTLYFPKF